MNARDENLEAWRSVAGGWERRRELIWTTTRPVAERLVDLLEPRPGQVILELAAGPGDTGFSALPRLLPGGRLVTTDVAPEMLDAARRRAAELGLEDVSFAVEDAAALTFDDDAFDGILCRWGLMLVPAMGHAAAEMARVMSGVSFDVSNYLTTHPDVNDYFTSLKGQPRDQVQTQVQNWLDANPQVRADLQAIRQPSVDFRNRCGVPQTP